MRKRYLHNYFSKAVSVLLIVFSADAEAIETFPTPDSWSFPQVIESAREIAPKNIEGRAFNQHGLVYSPGDQAKLDFTSMPPEELQKYADIVTHAYPDAIAMRMPSSCSAIPVEKLNETAIAGLGYISIHAMSEEIRKRALQCLTILQSKLASGQSKGWGWISEKGERVEDTDSMKSIDGFSGMLLITPDADWKEKWETPPEVVPRLSSADTVKIGEKLTILIFFVNPKIDLENKIDLDCDIRTIRPDGSFTFDLKDYDCGNGELKGNPGNVRLARAVISFEAEPSDEPGDWWIEVKLKDKVADIEIPLKTKFVLLDSESQ